MQCSYLTDALGRTQNRIIWRSNRPGCPEVIQLMIWNIIARCKKQDARKRWDATMRLRWPAPAHNEQVDPTATRRLTSDAMVPLICQLFCFGEIVEDRLRGGGSTLFLDVATGYRGHQKTGAGVQLWASCKIGGRLRMSFSRAPIVDHHPAPAASYSPGKSSVNPSSGMAKW